MTSAFYILCFERWLFVVKRTVNLDVKETTRTVAMGKLEMLNNLLPLYN